MFISLRHQLKITLSQRSISIAIVLIAITARIIQLLFFYNIRVDASYQIMATDNFLHGHGISSGRVNPFNLLETIYKPLTNWPPGYSLLLAPIYALFNHNYIAAGLSLDIIMAIVLIMVCRKILNSLDTPIHLINVFTLLNGFFIYYFYFIASSDAIAISFFLLGIYYCIRLLKNTSRYGLNALLMALFLFIAALTKYLFMPVVFVIPFFLAMRGYLDKDTKSRNWGVASLIILAFSVSAVLIYQAGASKTVGYISSPTRGFFPEHLLGSYPFMLSSFINPDTVAQLTGLQLNGSSFIYRLLQLLQLLLTGVLLFYFFSWAWRSKLKNMSVQNAFFCLSLFCSVAITNVLMILSLQVSKEEILPGYLWTYVEEARYYGLINVLLHLAVFLVYRSRMYSGSALKKYLFAGLVFLLVPELCRSAYFHFNRITLFGKEEYSWQYENRFQQYADTIVQKAKAAYPATRVIVTGSSYYYNHRVSLYSHVPVLYDPEILDNSFHLTKPVVVINIIDEKDVGDQRFSFVNGEKLAGSFKNFSFFIKYAAPR